jgi:hypothetical protein
MDPVTGMLVLSVAARVGESVMEMSAADQKLASLNMAKDESIVKHQQKTLANFDTTQKILDSQIASATTRGVGLGSSSLEAIQRHTFNIGAKKQQNLDTEQDLIQENIAAEKSNVRDTLFSELFGNAASTASDFSSVKSKMPSKATG